MLGVEDEEEDLEDTHLCIKCNRTLIGIENYIKHRKDKTCGRDKSSPTLNRVQDDPPYGDRMGSDGFGFNYTGETPKAHEPTSDVKLPTENLEYHYDLGADIFFSSLELQSSSKRNPTKTPHDPRVLTRKATAAIISSHHEDDWIPEQHHSESEKLMKAVSEIGDMKKDLPIFHRVDFPQESAESSSEDEDIDDFGAPPRNHTGGKWKPPEPGIPASSPWRPDNHWDEESLAEKWNKLDKSHEADDPDDDFFSPPSNHTKGKWVPGSKITKLDYKNTSTSSKSIEKVPKWCYTCNRKLASQQMYDRHLKSNLHKRKSLPEIELGQSFLNQQSRMSYYAQQLLGNPVKEDDEAKTTKKTKKEKKLKRIRRKIYSRCDVCRMKMRHHLVGKHLISHYHYRRMHLQPQKCLTTVLNNIHRIVLQSPFQCQPCRFYANTEESFMSHWNSASHQETVSGVSRLYCHFCKFECPNNASMSLHLIGVDHQEVIWAINRSVPIIIREKIIIKCDSCNREFRYNIELRRHSASCKPLKKESSGSDTYQSKFFCSDCHIVFTARKSLQRHDRDIHSKNVYFCSPCDATFDSADAAKVHRTTLEHKLCSAKKRDRKDLTRTCSVCQEKLEDILKLKEHILKVHPEKMYICSGCGEGFVLSQELSRHKRDKKCIKLEKVLEEEEQEEDYFEMLEPDLKENVKEEYVIQVLETEEEELEEYGSEDAFVCKICSKEFKTRSLLKQHLHVHREKVPCRRFMCSQEGCQFTGRSAGEVKRHFGTHSTEKKHHCSSCSYQGKTWESLKRHQKIHTKESRKELKCPNCEYTTSNSSHMTRHSRIHSGLKPFKCPHCPYSTYTSDNLSKHLLKTKLHRQEDK